MRWIASVALATFLSACGTTAQLTPQTPTNGKLLYVDGQPLLVSHQNNTVAVMIPSGSNGSAAKFKYDERIRFVLFVVNRTAEPIDFSPTNVAFQVNTEPQKVYSYEELLKEQQERDTWRAVAVGIAAMGRGMSAAGAGYSRHQGTVSTYGSGGHYSGTYSGTTYNAGAAALAQQQAQAANEADIEEMRSQMAAEHAALQLAALKRNSILPGQTVTGAIFADLPSPQERSDQAVLLVSLPGETHRFKFAYSEIE